MRPRAESAAPDDGSGALARGVLILGFGNTLRRDDGAGAVAARLLAADPRLAAEDVEVREAYQLLPEMALDLAEVGLVVFVDADMRGLPGSIEIHELDPAKAVRADADARSEPGASSHHVGGGELLALAAELTGHAPRAVAVGIGVADLEVGEGLSPVVESALPRVVEAVVGIVAEYRTGE